MRVALQISQAMAVVAREKMVDSLPQSRQLTFKNWLAMDNTSSVDQFELLCPLTGSIVRLPGLCASVEHVDPLGRLLTAIGFWTGETAVTRHDATEAALTPAEFRGALFLDALNGVERVLSSRRAVSLDLTWSLHHVTTSAFSPQRSGIYALRKPIRQSLWALASTHGILYKSARPASTMEEAMQAFVFFWLAGLALLVGLLLGFFSKATFQRTVGKVLLGAGLVSLLATPWTISFSSSSAFGHFLGSIAGPCVLVAVGLYQLAFSGNVPVGRLSNNERIIGGAMVVLGVIWLEAMHWWTITPTYPSDVNRYWLIFWPTMLLFGFACATCAYALVGLTGKQREREQRLMLAVAGFLLTLMMVGISMDGPNVSSEQFTVELLLAAADLFGVLVGTAIAVLLFALVLFVYERQLPEPQKLAAPTAEQLKQAAQTIARHTSGGEEE